MTAKAKILIVDDEANTLASLSRAFRLAGHEAVVCDNAARALELARTQPFDLILSDVVMPRRDGLALLEDLKTAGVAAPRRRRRSRVTWQIRSTSRFPRSWRSHPWTR